MDSNNENKEVNTMPKPLFNASWVLFIALIGIGWVLNYQLFDVFSIREYLTVNLYAYIATALILGFIVSVIVNGVRIRITDHTEFPIPLKTIWCNPNKQNGNAYGDAG